MIGRVPLDRVMDNPYQTRTVYGDVAGLAKSILKMKGARPETSGLIQVPPARVVVPDGWGGWKILDPEAYGGVSPCLGDEPEARVELAAGHRRLRAFRYLCNGSGEGDYATFPVEVQVLDDQAMADIAWEENSKRKDLTAIEEAEALRRAIDRFGWTQAEVGKRWGLSQPAVANKLRLLQLPEEAQAAIRAGTISERHGRALLSAQGKGEHIYRMVAEDVLPTKVAADVVEKARPLIGKRDWHEARSLDANDAVCDACEVALGSRFYFSGWGDDRQRLCIPCYRAAVDWSPPVAAEVENIVRQVIKREAERLVRGGFPLDIEIGGDGDLPIQSSHCTECPAKEMRDNEWWCLNKACFKAKEDLWYGTLVIRLQERILRDLGIHGGEYRINQGYSGYDLRKYDETDAALVENGVCALGKCERLQLRYIPYPGESFIRLYPDLPFILQCNNTNAHHACQRRFLASQRTEDDIEAEKQAKQSAETRRKAGHVILARAELSVVQALRDRREDVWRALAEALGEKAKSGQEWETSARQVAASLISGKDRMKWILWESEDAEEQFEDALRNALKRLGVRMLSSTDDLIRRMERISDFIGDIKRGERGLTPEMVKGNLANLTGIEMTAAEALRDGRMSQQDHERIAAWVEELRGELEGISREMET
jgi:ParB/RepB/Spo0J family partition protein